MPLAAQEAAPRFAFFNLNQLVESSVKAKKVATELEVLGKNLQDKIQAKAAEGQKLQQQLQSSGLSDQGREQLQGQLKDLEYEFKKLQENSQAELNKVRGKVMGQLEQLVRPLIDKMAKEQKLQVVFNGDATAQMLVYADESWFKNFTAELAKRLDESEGTPAAAEEKPAASKPAPKKKG
jgi:Skp family chaperone for outer membrane proteins